MRAKPFLSQYFKDLVFKEKTHEYFAGGIKIPLSVTKLVQEFYEPFDLHTLSLRVANKEGRSQQEVQEEWKQKGITAAQKGTEVHEYARQCAFEGEKPPKDKYQTAALNFVKSLPGHVVPFLGEYQMYHKEFEYAGTCDLVLHNEETENFVICDYKTNKDLFKNWHTKTMLSPFEFLLECDFNKYQLQLSLYQMMFEQTGAHVSSRKVIWLRTDGNFEIHDAEDYTKSLTAYLKYKYARQGNYSEDTVAVQ